MSKATWEEFVYSCRPSRAEDASGSSAQLTHNFRINGGQKYLLSLYMMEYIPFNVVSFICPLDIIIVGLT